VKNGFQTPWEISDPLGALVAKNVARGLGQQDKDISAEPQPKIGSIDFRFCLRSTDTLYWCNSVWRRYPRWSRTNSVYSRITLLSDRFPGIAIGWTVGHEGAANQMDRCWSAGEGLVLKTCPNRTSSTGRGVHRPAEMGHK